MTPHDALAIVRSNVNVALAAVENPEDHTNPKGLIVKELHAAIDVIDSIIKPKRSKTDAEELERRKAELAAYMDKIHARYPTK